MRQNNKNKQSNRIIFQDLEFLLNEEEKTLFLTKSISNQKDIYIPRSIHHGTHEFIITSITSKAFEYSKTESIHFPANSELLIIHEDAFRCSNINSIFIPSSVIEFEKGWCHYAYHLNNITIIQNKNRFISNYGENFIIGKSTQKSDTYDILIFVCRDVEEVLIPPFIKKISPYAFNYCNKLKTVIFSENSDISIIDSEAFTDCSIEKIIIVPQITQICERAFYCCHKLMHVEIPPNSQLQKIENSVFVSTSIDKITIPYNVTEIGQYAFNLCQKLKQVEFPKNSKLRVIEKFAFRKSYIENITIPSHVTLICSNAFSSCKNLKKIEFSINSELQEIEEYAFSKCRFESISIPSSVKSIGKSAFFSCKNLQRIEFPSNSEIQQIGSSAFQGTSIELFLVPSHVTHIKESCFIFCRQLKRFEIRSDSELKVIEDGAFCGSSIESIMIPSDIELKEGWCRQTSNLNEIKIIQKEKQNIFYFENKFLIGKSNQENEIFDVLLFTRRDITTAIIPQFIKKISYGSFFSCEKLERVFIPSKVTEIGMSAFHSCQKLKKIELQNNSKLQKIDKYAFIYCSITSFYIPDHVREIGESSFINCKNLLIVEIDENSELKSINIKDFHRLCILMIPQKLIHIIKIYF